MPHPCHAPIMPFFSRPRHSTVVERRPVGYLPAFGFFLLLRGVPRIPVSDAGGQCETKHCLSWKRKRVVATHYKNRSVTLLDQQFGYFRLPCGHSRWTRHCRTRAGARRGMCELTHGMAGERHRHGMLCVNRPLESS